MNEVPEDDDDPPEPPEVTTPEEQIEEEIWRIFERYSAEADITYRQLISTVEIIKHELIAYLQAETRAQQEEED